MIPQGIFPLQCNPFTPLSFSDISELFFIKYGCVNNQISLWNIFFAVKITLKYDVCILSHQKFQIWVLVEEEKAEQVSGVALGLWDGCFLAVLLPPTAQDSRPLAMCALTRCHLVQHQGSFTRPIPSRDLSSPPLFVHEHTLLSL